MDVHIRNADPDDAGPLADLIRSIGWFTHINAEPEETTRAHVQSELNLCLANRSHSVWVAETAAGTLVGYVSVHWLPYLIHASPEGYISELFIHESARGQGIGTKLLDVVVQEAKTRGCFRLMLINMRGRESYQRAFYKKQGWEERPDAANFVYLLEKV